MHRISEAKTRKELIDPALETAGWHLRDKSRVGLEIPVDGYDAEPWNGVTDYCLYRENGEVIAVVEAKRTLTNPKLAEAQAVYYIHEIAKHQSFKPFAFLTNGYDIYFLDEGVSSKRQVYGFFTPDDLERKLFTRLNQKPLLSIPIDNRITDRLYQHEAIRRVCEGFEHGKRKALVVMATGTGKTRTAMSLIDVYLRANQVQNVLFVADRDALVEQAITDGFRKFLPDEPCARLYSYNIDKTRRLFAVTLQTLSNSFEQFSPAFFDLIIFDEVHRSIFNKFNEVLDYFDGLMIGLTATPAQFIARDTFRAFYCDDGKPTFLYTYQQAIDEHYLVDYSLYAARTKFQRQGIKGVDLTEEERNSLIEQGIDPDEIDFEGTQLEKDVSNKGTLRKQWEEIWDTCLRDKSGTLPGKTIIFAMTQEHALRLEQIFNEMYPQFPNLVKVITHKSEFKGTLIREFKTQAQPRFAISVDMLDTGIDVPEVVNLVFMKPIQSRIKLDQMIGRGTRSQEACRFFDLLPGGVKTEFLVIDFWENDFNKKAEEVQEQTVPVLVTIFNTRLKLLETFLGEQNTSDCQRVISDLRSQVGRIPQESFTVKKVLSEIEEAWEDVFWAYLTTSKLDFLRLKVGPLLRLAPDVDVAAETFISKVERLKLQVRLHRDTSQTVQSIAEDVGSLPDFVVQDPELGKLAKRCVTKGLEEASQTELSQVAEKLAPQMKFKKKVSSFLTLDLQDVIELSGYIVLTQHHEKVYVKEYRQRVEQAILDFVETHPVLQAIGRGEPVDDLQLLALERDLQKTLAAGALEMTPENIRKAYGVRVGSLLEFFSHVLGLDTLPDYEQIVRRQFQEFSARHSFGADQARFLRAVQSVFLQKRQLAHSDLYQEPLTNFGANAVERWFSKSEVAELLNMVNTLNIGMNNNLI